MPKIIIAACQMRVSKIPEENLEKIARLLSEAKKLGATIAGFPECAVSGYPPLLYKKTEDIPIEAIECANSQLGSVVGQLKIASVIGTITERNGSLYNSALVFNEGGHLIGSVEKIHLFKGDASFFAAGNKLEVFDICGIKTSAAICYDIRFPEQFRILKEAGAELVFVPLYASGPEKWKFPVFEGAFRTRAAENGLYIAAVNAAVEDQTCVSRICDMNGVSLAEAEIGVETVITAELEACTAESEIYADRRTDLYEIKFKAGN